MNYGPQAAPAMDWVGRSVEEERQILMDVENKLDEEKSAIQCSEAGAVFAIMTWVLVVSGGIFALILYLLGAFA